MRKLIVTVFVVLVISTTVFSKTTIRITNGEWEPYLSQYSYEYGLASHIVHEAFKSEGVNIRWGFFPWKRAYEEAKFGKEWDASAVWWPTDKTKERFFVSEPVIRTSFVFFHRKNQKFQWKSIEDLKGLQIGFTRGYDYGKEFMAAMKEGMITVQKVSSDEQNYKKLLAGRIDIFPNDPVVGYAQIRNSLSPEKADLLTHHPKEFEPNTLNLIISRKCVDGWVLLEQFNTGLKKLHESRKIDQMYKDLHGGKYDKQKIRWIK